MITDMLIKVTGAKLHTRVCLALFQYDSVLMTTLSGEFSDPKIACLCCEVMLRLKW